MKNILLIICTAIVIGPIGFVIGYKFAAKEKYEYGKYHGRLDTLIELYENIQAELGYKVHWIPVPNKNNEFQADKDVKKRKWRLVTN